MAETGHENWVWRKMRRVVQVYGSNWTKRLLWNREFSTGRWNCLIATEGDPVYPVLEKYCTKQGILDLGCGSGNTANELAPESYSNYTGVDVSDEAVKLAAERLAENVRLGKVRFLQSDIESYVPDRKYQVILFRDSIYYLPRGKLKATLDRYKNSLEPNGVFVVRVSDIGRHLKTIMRIIESDFEIVEKHLYENPWALVIVFR